MQHTAFHLRFTNLEEVELACKEDEETRASRFIDWLGTRIARRAPKWVDEVSQRPPETSHTRMPWWDDLKKCVEGDWIPSRSEGWNHPVAVIYAVSTMAPNPLQAVSLLYSRPLDLPPWVESSILRYILIIHPKNSPLNNDECTALYNAVKKQYGLHVHVLNLVLEPGPKPIPIISLPPQLPLPESVRQPYTVPDTSELFMSDSDAQATGKFVREFLTQSLIPWMEKNVMEWNEAFNSKGLPSRLFTSTRRLFGSSTVTPSTPTTGKSFSPTSPATASISSPSPPQHRRLAEFATFLGDFKLAVTVFESLRRDGKGGTAVLPLMLAPGPILISHAAQALAPVSIHEPSATALLNALVCAVRWETGIQDFLQIGGERWLAWAASTADEAPTALLLGHAAHLSKLKGSKRRAALWYVMSAHRLEKVGIKSLTAHFLREARALYESPPEKLLSPAYAEAEQWPKDNKTFSTGTLPLVLANIEHSLGRIHYSSGDTEAAVRLFLGLLRYSIQVDATDMDSVIIDDFKQALEHLESTHTAVELPKDLTLPIRFCVASESTVRLNDQNEAPHSKDQDIWTQLETNWTASQLRKIKLEHPQAEVNRQFWLDLELENPLETAVLLKRFMLGTKVSVAGTERGGDEVATCQVIDEVYLYPREKRMVPICITPHVAGTLLLFEARYYFLSSLPVVEPIAVKGKRLNDTLAQRQEVTYAPSQPIKVPVRSGGCIVAVELVNEEDEEEDDLVCVQGEICQSTMRITNRGVEEVREIWMTTGDSVFIWLDTTRSEKATFDSSSGAAQEAFTFSNHGDDSTSFLLPLEQLSGNNVLSPGHFVDVPILLYAPEVTDKGLNVLFTYSSGDQSFYYTQFARPFQAVPAFDITATVQTSPTTPYPYILRVEVENVSEDLELEVMQISGLSMFWELSSSIPFTSASLLPYQILKSSFGIQYKPDMKPNEIQSLMVAKLAEFLTAKSPPKRDYPEALLHLSHLTMNSFSLCSPSLKHFILSTRRKNHIQALTEAFPIVPRRVLQNLFPLYGPNTLDLVLLWKSPTSSRYGILLKSNIQVGVGHGLLEPVLERVAQSKGKSMYAETMRENELLLQHFRECEWNRETDPLVVVARPFKAVVEHDFATGPCLVPIELSLHNYSPTHPLRYTLRLSGVRIAPHNRHSFIATYSGQLTHHGQLGPQENATARAQLRAPSSGSFSIDGWQVEVEVGEPIAPSDENEAKVEWKSLARYAQHPSGAESTVLVRNTVRLQAEGDSR